MRPVLIGVSLWSLTVAPATAQQLPPHWTPRAVLFRSVRGADAPRSDSPAKSSNARGLGAILGGAGGMVVGADVGYSLDRRSGPCDDFCGVGGFIVGGLLGESLGMVAGATLADPSGTRPTDWLVVPAITLVGTALTGVSGRVEVMLLIPVAQLYVLLSHDEVPAGPPSSEEAEL